MIETKKIKDAYLNFSNKDIKLWCYYYQQWDWIVQYVDKEWFYIEDTEYEGYVNWAIKIEKIIWNPLMIWDILHFLQTYANWPDYFDNCIEILDLWLNKQLPLECQNEKCIDYVNTLWDKRVLK